MKLYATTTSERATKGQGGNKILCIYLTNEKRQVVGEIVMDATRNMAQGWIGNDKIDTYLTQKAKSKRLYKQ